MQCPSTRNIAEMLRYRADLDDGSGLAFQDIRLTWKEVFRRAGHLAQRLEKRGIGRGHVVGILAPHSPAQVTALFGIALADAAFSIVNPLLRPDQIEHQMTDAHMGAMVSSQDIRQDLATIQERYSIPWIDIELDGSLSIDDAAEDDAAENDAAELRAPRETVNIPVDVANIIYTSGSTGRPKGVVVPHRTLLDGARIVSSYLGITPADRTLSILPLGFDYGLNQLMTAVFTGASLVMHNFVMPMDLLRVLRDEEITGVAAVPSIWPGVLAHLARRREVLDLPSLRYITTAGGAHAPELLRQLDDGFPATEIIIMYGLTESFRSTYLPYSELHKRPGCVGRPVPEVEILVLDEEGNPCPPGVKGELVHRGAFVTYGYLNNPDMTAQRFIDLPGLDPGYLAEKAVRSGDLVSKTDDGFINFHGRMDSQIKTRGYRVSPDEVSEAAMNIGDVKLAAAFGIPDDQLGERIVVAYETHSEAAIPTPEFLKQLDTALPSYARPSIFRFYSKLPTTANGKLDITSVRRESMQLD